MKNDVVKLRNIPSVTIKYTLVYTQVVFYGYLTLEISKFPKSEKREKFKKKFNRVFIIQYKKNFCLQ